MTATICRIYGSFCALLAIGGLLATSVYAQDIRFGVIAPRGAPQAQEQWSALVEHLHTATGRNVTLVPIITDQVDNIFGQGIVDFYLGNPVTALVLVEKHGAKSMVTMASHTGTEFAGTIISKKGSGITRAADLKDRKVMAFKFNSSAAAYVFQVYHLKQQRIDPFKDFAEFVEAKKQDDIVMAVQNGFMDAGFIKSGLLESMTKEGKINMADFEIVDQRQDNLTHLHSTSLYPEWYVVAAKETDAATISAVTQALISVTADSPAAKTARIKGFVPALDMKPLRDAMTVLKIPPFDA